MAEILEFRVPPGNGRTLLVLGLESDELEHALHLTFSAFGLLYSVKINSNATVAGPGYYAFIKFYSARDANKAQQACNGKSLFQKTALKVYMCTRQRALARQTLTLNSYKSQELANYYLGFDGWSSRVITLQNVSGSEDDEKEGGGTLPRHHRSKYLCVQELIIPNYGINTRGFGVAELHVNPGPEFLTASRNAQRSAVQQALSDAFRKILFIIFENGQLAVEYSWAEKDPLDSLTEEELRGRIQARSLQPPAAAYYQAMNCLELGRRSASHVCAHIPTCASRRAGVTHFICMCRKCPPLTQIELHITELSFSELDRLGKEEILCTDGE